MWGTIIGAGASLLGGLLGNNSAKKASQAQIQGMQQGADAIKGYYNEGKSYMQPYADAGGRGLTALLGLMDDPSSIAQNPAYQWRLKQGMGALDNSAASRGMLFSGAHSKDAMEYGQGMASQEYDNQWNRMMGLSGMGFNAGSNIGQMGADAGRSLAGLYGGMGDARASSYAAQGSNNANMLGGLAGLFGGGGFGGWGGGSSGPIIPNGSSYSPPRNIGPY